VGGAGGWGDLDFAMGIPPVGGRRPMMRRGQFLSPSLASSSQRLHLRLKWRNNAGVKMVDFQAVKRQEARARMRLLREAAGRADAAAAIQKRVSLVGDGARWEITNLKEFARSAATRWS